MSYLLVGLSRFFWLYISLLIWTETNQVCYYFIYISFYWLCVYVLRFVFIFLLFASFLDFNIPSQFLCLILYPICFVYINQKNYDKRRHLLLRKWPKKLWTKIKTLWKHTHLIWRNCKVQLSSCACCVLGVKLIIVRGYFYAVFLWLDTSKNNFIYIQISNNLKTSTFFQWKK